MPFIHSNTDIPTHFTPHILPFPPTESTIDFSESVQQFGTIISEAGIRLVLLYGTCLGIYRDTQLIEYDTDADFGVYLADFDALNALTPTLAKHGFYIHSRNVYSVTYRTPTKPIDIWVIIKRKNPFFRCLGYKWLVDHVNFKTNYFETPVPLSWGGQTYYIPHNVEAYLQELYGPKWRQPQRDRHAGPRSQLSQWLNAPFVDFDMPGQFSGVNSVGTYKPWCSFLLKKYAPHSKLCQLFNHPDPS